MKKLLYIFLLALLFLSSTSIAQCGQPSCNPNTGILSNDNATDIAYDNMGSAFHSTYIKEPNGGWKVWGEFMANNGADNALTPQTFNSTNYPALTGSIYKMGMGSDFGLNVQLIVLTSDGLFVLGNEGAVISDALTSSSVFQKISVNGKLDGLPTGVSPDDVKMMFVANRTITITTCIGEVYVLSQYVNIRGNGGTGNATQWSRVMVNATTPLTDVIVARGTSSVGFALKSDGTIWTWGDDTYLGDGLNPIDRNFAAQMILPVGIPGIKMIQATNSNYNLFGSTRVSYFVVGFDKKVYSLGSNNYGQLGDRTSTNRTVWVNAKNPDNTIITDAAWISSNEHDENLAALAVIKTNGVIYTAGCNSFFMIGRTEGGDLIEGAINYLDVPTGITNSDFITFVEVGGHTCALIKQCYSRYGYVGHRVRGSIGDGTDVNETISSYDFTSPPEIAVCGAQYLQPVVTTNSPICPGQDAIYTVTATPGDILTYNINGGASQTITIAASGTSQIIVPNATTNQQINFTQIFSINTTCEYNLAIVSIVDVGIPVFTQVPPICFGSTLNPLPLVSNNGIVGTWSPAINNTQTTTYTFTPTSGVCSTTATMTITVFEINTTVANFAQVGPICAGDTIALPSVSTNGVIGSWSPSFDNTTTTTYTFTPNLQCVNPIQMTVVVNPKVTPQFTPVGPICEGTNLPNLPTISTEGITGTWSPAINTTTTTTYTFTPSSNWCANLTQMTIVVNPKLTPLFPSFVTQCYGTTNFVLPTISNNGISGTWSPQFDNTQSGTYTFTPNSQECAFGTSAQIQVFADFNFDYTVFCQNNDFFIQLQSDDVDLSSTIINWEYDNATIFSDVLFNVSNFLDNNLSNVQIPLALMVTVTDTNGCDKTKMITVNNPFCSIPNVITPNEDEYNNYFDLSLLKPKHLIIFNRWGKKVYEKDNYLNEWYGQNDSGGKLPEGVYFYLVELPEETKTGWIQILREEN
ncbi:MAG: gliding motility-associated C-terminal domain-containing protein [Flavobacterium sp.]|nr:gliding motility-associated C-terminal domain-containing protein [Flavobacterium sp.]